MIYQNQSKLDNKVIKNKPGLEANESMFGGDLREMRERKTIKVPSINANLAIKLEQGWNERARKRDIIKITIGNVYAFVERAELEQGLWAMCQKDEMIKYCNPQITSNL